MIRRLPIGIAAGLLGGGKKASILPFTDDFNRADGAIGGQWTGAGWTIVSGRAKYTPTLGSELLTNPGFETYTGTQDDDTHDTFANWTEGLLGTGGYIDSVTDVVSGTAAVKMTSATVGRPSLYQGVASLTTSTWHRFSVMAKVSSGGLALCSNDSIGLPVIAPNTGATTYTKLEFAAFPTATSLRHRIANNTNDKISWFDDASVKSCSTVFATLPDSGQSNVTAQAVLPAMADRCVAGFVLNLDDPTNPQNYILAMIVKNRGYIYKCTAGVLAAVTDAALAWNTAHNLKVVKDGGNCTLYYGATGSETSICTTATLGAFTGTYHGLFSTHESNLFEGFTLT